MKVYTLERSHYDDVYYLVNVWAALDLVWENVKGEWTVPYLVPSGRAWHMEREEFIFPGHPTDDRTEIGKYRLSEVNLIGG